MMAHEVHSEEVAHGKRFPRDDHVMYNTIYNTTQHNTMYNTIYNITTPQYMQVFQECWGYAKRFDP